MTALLWWSAPAAALAMAFWKLLARNRALRVKAQYWFDRHAEVERSEQYWMSATRRSYSLDSLSDAKVAALYRGIMNEPEFVGTSANPLITMDGLARYSTLDDLLRP